MTGDTHFDSEVKKLVMAKNGGEVTRDLFWNITAALGEDVSALIDAVSASNAAGEERHADTLRLLAIHSDEDALHRNEQAELCARTHANILARAPYRSTDQADAIFADMGRSMVDPLDSEFLEDRESAFPDLSAKQARSLVQIVSAWTTTGSLLKRGFAIAATALIGLVVAAVFAYCIAYYAADRAEKQGIEAEKTALPQPVVTVTVTPSQ